MPVREGIYGLLAEFNTPSELVHATEQAHQAGYRRMECYTPYPLNIAGRPLFSWPAFIIPAYEWTILFAGLSAAFGMLALNGLPQLYHPLFNAPNFRNGATTDKFFLCLEAMDPKFSVTETRAFLEQFSPASVVEVDH